MSKLDAFRKLIREEVKRGVREELKNFLMESQNQAIKPKKPVIQETRIKENYKPKFQAPPKYSDDPIQQLLSETAMGMGTDEYRTMMSADSGMAQGFPQMFMQGEESLTSQPQVVENVTEMLASARPTNDINQVNIDVVPDFSELMQTMKAKGQI